MSDPTPSHEARTLPPSPPLPNGAEAESLAPSAPPSDWATLPSGPGAPVGDGIAIPGYEIFGTLGRGGMGVVYQARHLKLGRVVALKMILSGVHAGEGDLARFRTEAEAIARLQHPNIVQVFEVGEHGGLPYFSLEFCGGGSLEKKLSGTPLPPKEAATLVETLARAMHAAHEKGIIHRDLKPANILLASGGCEPPDDATTSGGSHPPLASYTPKITDFGLAKKLDEAGQTASGAIMGTPSYMAPEQAGGQTASLGPACDVYALGAILYECLTGRPPFKAATALDTMLQVVSDEPVPPTELQSKTPRDLETICLKCLQKEPAKRYGSAAALAADLRRFLEGRPILARPVGRLERAAKWVRRNPALASMTAAFALTLLAATAISMAFGIDARQQASDAIAARNDLTTANDDLKRSRDDLSRNRDDLETTLALSLLRPLALQGGDEPMADGEWVALWELAASRPGRLGYRFVEEASRTSVTSQQLRDRAALALSTAVGLDEQRRAEVEKLLLARLDNTALEDGQKTDLALAAAAWDGLSSSAAVRVARQLTQAIKDTKDTNALAALAQALSAVAARLEPKDAATVAAAAATALVQAMKDTKDTNALYPLGQGLSAVAARLEPQDAAAAATALVEAMKDTKNSNALAALAQGLSAVAARLEPQAAAAAATALLQAIKDTKDAFALSPLAQGLSAVAARLQLKDAGTVAGAAATALVQAMKDTKNPYALGWLAQGLSAVAARLEPQDTAAAATALVEAMKDTKNPDALYPLAQALSAVAARLEPKDAATAAAAAATALVQAMKDTKNPYDLSPLAQGLSAVAAHMEPNDAATIAAAAATAFVQAMVEYTKNPNAMTLARALAAVLADVRAPDIPSRSATAVSAVALAAGTDNPLTGLAVLIRAAEPLPCRLSTQQLVELLKMPPCIGEARRVVLDQLGNRYHHRFADVWEFVRFAKEQHLDLDFTTPPQRP